MFAIAVLAAAATQLSLGCEVCSHDDASVSLLQASRPPLLEPRFSRSLGGEGQTALKVHYHIHKAGGTLMCELAMKAGERTPANDHTETNCNWWEHDALFDTAHPDRFPTCEERRFGYESEGWTYGQIERELAEGDLCEGFHYSTLLRNPLDLILSLANHEKLEHGAVDLRQRVKNLRRLIAEGGYEYEVGFVPRHGWKFLDNVQTRLLSGSMDVPPGKITSEHVKTARERLSRFHLVARLEDLYDPMKRQNLLTGMGWNIPLDLLDHKVNAKEHTEAFTDADKAWLFELNQHDYDLYNSVATMHPRFAISKIAHIKLHKVGSSTLSSILRRPCDSDGLRCALRRPGDEASFEHVEDLEWKAANYPNAFDIHWSHAVFDPVSLEIMSPGVFSVAAFRNPLDRVLSGLRDAFLSKYIACGDCVKQYTEPFEKLIQGQHWESSIDCGGYGVRMATQVPLHLFRQLDFVFLTEQFDLSLLLFRRAVGWDLADMLYLRFRDTSEKSLEEYPHLSSLYREVKIMLQENATRGPEQQTFYDFCIHGEERKIYKLAELRYQEQWETLSKSEQQEVKSELIAFQKGLRVLTSCCEEYPDDVYCGELGEAVPSFYLRHGWLTQAPSLPFPMTVLGERLPGWSKTSVCKGLALSALKDTSS